MRSRGYNKRIDIYETTSVFDGISGYTSSTSLIGSSWAKISTFNVGKNTNSTEFGLLDVNDSLIVTVRKRNDVTYNSDSMYIVYRGVKYIITTAPINVGFEDKEIQFIVKKASNTDVNEVGDINDLNGLLNTNL
jgi:head-tail adaptor